MSFGFSPSDIIALISIATRAYKGWKRACGEYSDITSSLDGLLILLKRIEGEAETPKSVLRQSDRADLKDILANCESTVRELNALIAKYKSLGSSREKNWDRLRFGVRNLGDLRAKLTQHVATIGAYLDTVGLGALGRIERDLSAIPQQIQQTIDSLVVEIMAGRREGSIMTTYEDDEKDVWKQFRRELISEGMRSSVIHKYKPRIRQYLRELAEKGELEEQLPAEIGLGGPDPGLHLSGYVNEEDLRPESMGHVPLAQARDDGVEEDLTGATEPGAFVDLRLKQEDETNEHPEEKAIPYTLDSQATSTTYRETSSLKRQQATYYKQLQSFQAKPGKQRQLEATPMFDTDFEYTGAIKEQWTACCRAL